MRNRTLIPAAVALVGTLLAGLSAANGQATRPAAAGAPTSRPLVAAAATTTAVPTPAVAPASVAGRVTAAGGKPLPEMIVYLEPADPAVKFPAPAEVVHLSQREAKFSPALVVVSVGQSVDFTNDEAKAVEHNVFSRSPAKPFDLGLYLPGSEPKLVTFDKPGPVRLFCSIHKFMDGAVYVCPTPYFARVAADGSYKLANVPPGAWRLKTWQRNPRFNERDVPLALAAGQAVEQNLELTRK